MQGKIQIACTPDDNYAQHCVVMLNSLFTNNPGQPFFIHVIINGLNQKNQKIIETYLLKHSQEYRFYTINESALSAAPVSRYITTTSYYRILLPSVLDKSIDKILYLDCDLLIRSVVTPLWNMDITGYYVAAVDNIVSKDHMISIGVKLESGYFNAGMILINLKKWREDDIMEKCFAFIQANAEKLMQHDQDVLNVLFQDNWLKLDYYWNVYHYFYREGYHAQDFGLSEEKYQEVKSSPGILHFTGPHKPWMYSTNHPLKREYFKYLKDTPWASFRAIGRPGVIQRIKTGTKKIVAASLGQSAANNLVALIRKWRTE